MNKEEQEAIEQIKYLIKFTEELHIYKTENKAYKIVLNLIDKLQKENKKYIDIFNSTEKIMNGQERTKDKLLKENVELQKELDNSINKDIIRDKIKEVAEESQIYVDTEKFDKEFEKSNYIIEVLKELLGE